MTALPEAAAVAERSVADPVGERVEPLQPAPPLAVLYDEDCPFCGWTVANLRRWDRARRLRFVPYDRVKQEPELAATVVGERLGTAIHVVDAAGSVSRGGAAFLAITALLPAGGPVAGLVQASPPARAAIELGYAAVNRWRGPLAAWFGFDGPRIHEGRPND
jgi:predicted DCC family thiol-disulfide oxidoreductase YuxK